MVLKSVVFTMQNASRPIEAVDLDEPRCFRHTGFITQNGSRLIEANPKTQVMLHKTDRGSSRLLRRLKFCYTKGSRFIEYVLKTKALGVQMSSRFMADVPETQAPAFRNASRFIDDETVRTLL